MQKKLAACTGWKHFPENYREALDTCNISAHTAWDSAMGKKPFKTECEHMNTNTN